MLSTLPTPPVNTPVSHAGQAVMTIGVAVGLVIIAVAAVRLGRKWSTAVPALLVLGTLFAGFYEPMENMGAHMWYYRPGQVTLFDAFDRSLPVWVFFSYAAFYGGFGLLAWWLTERGSPRSHIVRFVLGMWAFAIVTEIVGTQLNTYEYYGRAPFRVAGFPVWVSLSNAAICTTIGVAAARLRRHLVGRQQLALLCLGPAAITLGLVGTGFPTLVALNTVDPPAGLLYGAALVSMGMAAVMAWSATQLVPVAGLEPATAAEPVGGRAEQPVRTAGAAVKAGA
jgi:hypothetical protein